MLQINNNTWIRKINYQIKRIMMKKPVNVMLLLNTILMCLHSTANAEVAIWPPQPVMSENGKWRSEIIKTANAKQWEVRVFALDETYKKLNLAWSRIFDFEDNGGNRFSSAYVSPNGQTVIYVASYSSRWAIATTVQPNCTKNITSREVVIDSKTIVSTTTDWLKKEKPPKQSVSFNNPTDVIFHTLAGDYTQSLDCKTL